MSSTVYSKAKYDALFQTAQAFQNVLFYLAHELEARQPQQDLVRANGGYKYVPYVFNISFIQLLIFLQSLLRKKLGRHPRFLDVGCGVAFIPALADSIGFSATGLELDPWLVGKSNELLPNLPVINADARRTMKTLHSLSELSITPEIVVAEAERKLVEDWVHGRIRTAWQLRETLRKLGHLGVALSCGLAVKAMLVLMKGTWVPTSWYLTNSSNCHML